LAIQNKTLVYKQGNFLMLVEQVTGAF